MSETAREQTKKTYAKYDDIPIHENIKIADLKVKNAVLDYKDVVRNHKPEERPFEIGAYLKFQQYENDRIKYGQVLRMRYIPNELSRTFFGHWLLELKRLNKDLTEPRGRMNTVYVTRYFYSVEEIHINKHEEEYE